MQIKCNDLQIVALFRRLDNGGEVVYREFVATTFSEFLEMRFRSVRDIVYFCAA